MTLIIAMRSMRKQTMTTTWTWSNAITNTFQKRSRIYGTQANSTVLLGATTMSYIIIIIILITPGSESQYTTVIRRNARSKERLVPQKKRSKLTWTIMFTLYPINRCRQI